MQLKSNYNKVTNHFSLISILLLCGLTILYSIFIPNTSVAAKEQDEMLFLCENIEISSKIVDRSLCNLGNVNRLANVMRKAENGEEIVLGFIGGSVTEGSSASSKSKAYPKLVQKWFVDRFPNAKIKYVNAGIGATDSVIGVHRVKKDLLDEHPDFVIIEYSVNDSINNQCKETYENLIRRVLKEDNDPALMLLFMVAGNGDSAQSIHEEVGSYYDLPMVSFKNAIWPEISSGRIKWSDISNDTVHPNDHGYAITASFIVNLLEMVYKDIDSIPDEEYVIKEPLISSDYEDARMLDNKELKPVSFGGFEEIGNAFPWFRYGWKVDDSKEPVVFEIDAQKVTLLYKKDIGNYLGDVHVKVNDSVLTKLSGNFENGWGMYAAHTLVTSDNEVNKIEIGLSKGDRKEFVIVSVMIAGETSSKLSENNSDSSSISSVSIQENESNQENISSSEQREEPQHSKLPVIIVSVVILLAAIIYTFIKHSTIKS